mmetsp:Transcript_9066/g.8065  ORF Transcript_9066/g.8065 Transcript_9066/m.8065 type:complete len:159 (-) Transcript_9066:18-494(-)
MSLNKEEKDQQESSLGYLFIILANWLSGALFTIIRTLNLNNVHVSLNSGMVGLTFIIQSFGVYIYNDKLINIDKYTFYDVCILSAHGLLSVVWIWGLFFATKFAQASFICPIMNFENLFTIFVDIFLFQYHFTTSDSYGMTVLAVCIIAPIITRYFIK